MKEHVWEEVVLLARDGSEDVKSEMESAVMTLALVMGYSRGSSGQRAVAFTTLKIETHGEATS